MIERTLVLLKPDCVQRAICGEIISRFERTGFKVVALKMCYSSAETAGEHYANDEEWMKSVGKKTKQAYEKKGNPLDDDELTIGKRIRQQLMDFLMMAPVVAIVLEGHDVIGKVRTMVGATAPSLAVPGTIRGDYSFDSYGLADSSGRPLQNLIHASDGTESAEREIKIWFNDDEVHPYQRVDEALLYRRVK